MGVIGSTTLVTRNPKDIKKVVDYAIEQTKIQSLKDTGVEWQPGQSVGEDCYGAQRFDIFEDKIVWQDSSYYYPNNLKTEELVTKIAKQFPDIDFVLYESNSGGGNYEYLWDGNDWQEMKELSLGFIIDCDDKEKSKEEFCSIIECHLRPMAGTGYLRMIEVTDSDNLFVRCQFASDVLEAAFGHIEEFLNRIECNLHGIVAEYGGWDKILLKKVTVTDKEIVWTDCDEEEKRNFDEVVNAEEVKRIFG